MLNMKLIPFLRGSKSLGVTQYKYVYKYITRNGEVFFRARLNTYNWTKHFECPKQAAKAVDLFLIKNGKEPVNLLVKK